MWTTFPVTLLFFSLLAEALQRGAENNTTILERRTNLTQDVVFEGYARQTALVARNPPGLTRFINRINPSRSYSRLPPSHEQPQHDVIVVPLSKHHQYRLAEIKIGTPPQPFVVVVHTDSPCLWTTHEPGQSTSHRNVPRERRRTCESRLFKRSQVVGDGYLDRIRVGGMEEEGMVLSVTGIPESSQYKGGMGLALPPRVRFPCDPPKECHFVPYFILKRFPSPIFALHLTPMGGELHIGGPLAEYYHEDSIEYHSVTKCAVLRPWQRWEIGQAVIGINRNEEVLSNKIQTVFDSTSPYIYGPRKEVKKIYEVIRMHNQPMHEGYEHAFLCEDEVEVYFKWKDGQEWSLSPRQFRLRRLQRDGMCEGIIKGVNARPGSWVIGTLFMEGFYMVFDGTPKKPRVGLARLRLPPYESPPPSYYSSSSSPSITGD